MDLNSLLYLNRLPLLLKQLLSAYKIINHLLVLFSDISLGRLLKLKHPVGSLNYSYLFYHYLQSGEIPLSQTHPKPGL